MSFLRGITKEMRKVTWLSKKEVFGQFVALHIIAGVIIVYFLGIDLLVKSLKNLF